jgi:23S rRNA pseudouridine1911/1915/1917 synthase
MPRSEQGWIITPEELMQWLLRDEPHLAAFNKPAHVVCHPSKNGPWSSLAGACREFFHLDTVHMPFRLDRETSGVWLLVKTPEIARRYQIAVEQRRVKKTYLALLTGQLRSSVTVDQPLGRDRGSKIHVKQTVLPHGLGAPSRTTFHPLELRPDGGAGQTLCRVILHTGRLHQIRAHAAWLGHPVAGDKIYGPDETCFLEFIEQGFTDRLRRLLPLDRHALHCESVDFGPLGRFEALSGGFPFGTLQEAATADSRL